MTYVLKGEKPGDLGDGLGAYAVAQAVGCGFGMSFAHGPTASEIEFYDVPPKRFDEFVRVLLQHFPEPVVRKAIDSEKG